MAKFSTPPGLEGLFDLDRKGVDIRPTLLRVLTDQYLRTPVHTPDEERHYTELAMRLLDETDIATRAAVSVRLAPHACAPHAIMLQLARDVLEVAEPVLLHSPVLTPADCQAIIVERGICYADILARRGKPVPATAPAPVPIPAARVETPPGPVEVPAAPAIEAIPVASMVSALPPALPAPTLPTPMLPSPQSIAEEAPSTQTSGPQLLSPPTPDLPMPSPLEPSLPEPSLPGPNAPLPTLPILSPPTAPVITDEANSEIAAESAPQSVDDASARELCELFFAAGSAERRLILMNLDYAEWPAGEPPATVQRADVWRMETAALRHNTATVMRELERALGISYQQSRRIVEDELGEPIVIAGKAMSMPADVLQRIVLFLNPRVGQSIDRVYELSALYNEISVEAALRLVSILRAAEPAGQQQTRDTRAIYGAAEAAQQALSDVAATAARKPETVLRRAGGEG